MKWSRARVSTAGTSPAMSASIRTACSVASASRAADRVGRSAGTEGGHWARRCRSSATATSWGLPDKVEQRPVEGAVAPPRRRPGRRSPPPRWSPRRAAAASSHRAAGTVRASARTTGTSSSARTSRQIGQIPGAALGDLEAAVGQHLDRALPGEHLHRLAHRRGRHPVPPGERGRRLDGAGRQFPADDRRPQGPEHLVAYRQPLGQPDRRGLAPPGRFPFAGSRPPPVTRMA